MEIRSNNRVSVFIELHRALICRSLTIEFKTKRKIIIFPIHWGLKFVLRFLTVNNTYNIIIS